jgi:DUF1680 family protein
MLAALALCSALAPLAAAQDGATPHILKPVPSSDVVLEDPFWSPKLETCRSVTIADSFGKFERDGAIRNFDRVRDGQKGEHGGPPWYDGLIYEMIRGSADFLAARRDPDLEKRLDGYVEHIAAAAAKDPDGYLNTYTQLQEPDHRWGTNGGNDNWQHDCYNAGAMIEAAVHYFRATGKTDLLKTAARLANGLCDFMGPPPRRNVVPGHSIGEEALVKLHLLFAERPELKAVMGFPVDEGRYLKLAEFWIENRGNHEGRKSFEAYGQDHLPVLKQLTIEGHAVRATLLCAGLVAAASVNGREDYFAAARRLWENMAERRMYVTGGLGSTAQYEGFGPDWFLPNDGYLETCAAIGGAFFSRNMNLAFADARYADALETALYNGILCAVSLKGDTYYYENPLEAGKGRERWAWHGCPCCPPMLVKALGALPGYLYATGERGIWVNLFAGSRARMEVAGTKVEVREVSRYPWDGNVRISVSPAAPAEFDLHVRIPGWCRGAGLAVNGKALEAIEKVRGYARIGRTWSPGDAVDLSLPMPVDRIVADARVEADRGRVAIRRGPIVYCLEGVDHEGRARNLVVPSALPLDAEHIPDLLGGVTVVRGEGLASFRGPMGAKGLYEPRIESLHVRPARITAIPYYANTNRGPCETIVWAAEHPSLARAAPFPTPATEAAASASHSNPSDGPEAMNDAIEPSASDDERIPRQTFWDHRGTKEWAQLDFDMPRRVSAAQVYWWDERRVGRHCRVPKAWRLLYRDGAGWKPVGGSPSYGTEIDRFNRAAFEAVEATALRIELELQPEWSAGILEWKVE